MSTAFYNESQFRFGHDRITWSVRAIILATAAAFSLQLLIELALPGFMLGGPRGGPANLVDQTLAFSATGLLHGKIWTPFTYMLLHSGLSHLFFNMLMLYFFGPDVERALGTRQFLRFYVACGAIGVLLNVAVAFAQPIGAGIPIIGASGATLGVLVAFAVVQPERQLFLFPLPIPINARALVIILIVLNLVNALQGGDGTSVATHFGGMATGFMYMKYRPRLTEWQIARRKRVKKVDKTSTKNMEKLGEEIDNIFKFQDRDR